MNIIARTNHVISAMRSAGLGNGQIIAIDYGRDHFRLFSDAGPNSISRALFTRIEAAFSTLGYIVIDSLLNTARPWVDFIPAAGFHVLNDCDMRCQVVALRSGDGWYVPGSAEPIPFNQVAMPTGTYSDGRFHYVRRVPVAADCGLWKPEYAASLNTGPSNGQLTSEGLAALFQAYFNADTALAAQFAADNAANLASHSIPADCSMAGYIHPQGGHHIFLCSQSANGKTVELCLSASVYEQYVAAQKVAS